MILGNHEIKARLNKNEIFRAGTWIEQNIKEASYALRAATDGLIIDGNPYPVGEHFPKDEMRLARYIEIMPGKIAILSTQEELNMPGNLVGRLGIRLNFAALGLTGFMGIQVDPYYGSDHLNERLYIRVANMGNEPILLQDGDPVFNIEFSQLETATQRPKDKPRTWERLLDIVRPQAEPSWTHLTQVQADFNTEIEQVQADIKREIDHVREYLQPVVLFGIFLVAVTILGVVVLLLLGAQQTPAVRIPSWVTDWGRALILATLSGAAVLTAAMGVIGCIAFLKQRQR